MSIELSGLSTNTDKKPIWIVSELFYPETISTGYILTEIAKSLSEDFTVSVIAGPEFYEAKNEKKEFKTLPNITIHRIQNGEYNKNSFLSRIIGHLKVTFKMLSLMRRHIPKDAEILMVTNPVLLMVLAGRLARSRKWKIRLIVHDVFPENLVISGFIKSKKAILYKVTRPIFNNAFTRISTLIVLGRDMKDFFLQKVGDQNDIAIIENWADTENIQVHPQVKNDRIHFLFAGNMGRLQGIETLLEVLRTLEDQDYQFQFIGSGALDSFIEDFIKENQLTKIEKLGWLPREEQDTFMANSHIGVVTLKKGMYGLGVPSKVYNLLAAGKPIFYIGDQQSEVHRLLKEHNIGWYAEAGNPTMIREVILQILNTSEADMNLLSINARQLAERSYSKETILKKYNTIFYS